MTTGAVTVVTDSTAYLPDSVVEELGIIVVPLRVQLGDDSYQEGVDLPVEKFVEWITPAGRRALTSQPSPAAFQSAYESAPGDIVSVHLSTALSGTTGAARLAGEQLPDRKFRVVDSRNIAMGLGFAVIAAATAAAEGASLKEVAVTAERAASRTRTTFYVDSLEYLRRGGRIGAARSLVGGALSVKPLLHIVDGEIAVLERIRTASRAIARLEDVAALTAGHAAVDVAVQHLGALERAEQIAERLSERIPGAESIPVSSLGPVVGTHVGPGTVGVVVHKRGDFPA